MGKAHRPAAMALTENGQNRSLFPLIPWGSIGWRMGHGEVYWHEWGDWFRSISPKSQAYYQNEWPEPAEWSRFYECIFHGAVRPRIHEQHIQDEEQQPPRSDEYRIDEPSKVRWMARIYLQKTNARGDGIWAIYVDPNGQFWKLCEATPEQRIGPFLWFERFGGNLVGPDNTPESVRTVRGTPVTVPKPGC